MLFKDDKLNIAILISASWHLVWMFSISPIILPEHVKKNSTTIAFLGSILERVTIAKEKSFIPGEEPLSGSIDNIKNIDSNEIILAQPDIVSGPAGVQPKKEQFLFGGDNSNYAELLKASHKKDPEIKFSNLFVRGSARDRIILYKPDLLRIPIMPSDFNSDYTANVRFRVSKYGFVEDPECIVSSGSSEIDQLAIRYVRKWQFAPRIDNLEEPEEGIARINFEVN